MKTPVIHQLRTPTGRAFQLSIAADGTRVIAAHFHKRELLTIALALEAAFERARDQGRAGEQRDCEQLRDLFLNALHHDA